MPISIEKMKESLEYDPETGRFMWKVRSANRVKVGDYAGSKRRCGYIRIVHLGYSIEAHRLAWAFVYGELPSGEIDHVNGIKSDNRIDNLRNVTRLENNQNHRSADRDSKTQLLGVTIVKSGRFRATITANGKFHHIGTFDDKEQASNAYVDKKRLLHKGNTL